MIEIRDKEVIKNMASQVAEIAALSVQKEKRRMWRRLNVHEPESLFRWADIAMELAQG